MRVLALFSCVRGEKHLDCQLHAPVWRCAIVALARASLRKLCRKCGRKRATRVLATVLIRMLVVSCGSIQCDLNNRVAITTRWT